MPGKPMPIGPFTGGLNNISQAGEAQDTEVVSLVNMNVSVDGSLTSRAPITLNENTLVSKASGSWKVYGIHRVTVDEWYLLVGKPTATGITIVAFLKGQFKASPDYIVKTIAIYSDAPVCSVQYADTTYFVHDALTSTAAVNFKWSPLTGSVDVPAIPKGSKIISWNDRLWVSATGVASTGNRVRFSDIDETGAKPETWPASNWFDVSPGEGGFITNILVSFNNMIIFKNDGTWKFSYGANPNKHGEVTKVDGYVGAAGPDCVVEFENLIYVYDNGIVYELINNNFTQINRKVEFKEDIGSFDQNAEGVSLSIVNRKLIVQYHSSVYVFSIDTKAWSLWRSIHGTPGKFTLLPADSFSSESPVFVAPVLSRYQAPSSNLVDQRFERDKLQKYSPYEIEVGLGSITFEVPAGFNNTFNMVFNYSGSDTITQSDFDIPVSPGQEYELSNMNPTEIVVADMYMRFYLEDGTTSVVNPISGKVTAPVKSVLGRLEINFFTNPPEDSEEVTISNITIKRPAGIVSSAKLVSFKDEYRDTSMALEFIETEVITKSYDYGQPAYFKRLYMWGADIRAFRSVRSVLTSLGRKKSITWGDLNRYSLSELSYGTWGNPLSFLDEITGISDVAEIPVEYSENGRYYIKLGRGMRIRFKQVHFTIKTSTMGNRQTGPVKLFSLTTFVDQKSVVTAKVT